MTEIRDAIGSEHLAKADLDDRIVFFFDIDNCLYPRSKKVQDLMQDLIDAYLIRHLSLSPNDATELHQRYYKEYGLAISGLVKHHRIDPLAYNREVDDALPLEGLITRDDALRSLLSRVDRSKVKLWLFTNAYITHARRVIRLLGIEDMFEGLTFCDYAQVPIVAKPHDQMFKRAEQEAGVLPHRAGRCIFVDDSALNCRHASARGWTTIHKLEPDDLAPIPPASKYHIRDMSELPGLFPNLFKTA